MKRATLPPKVHDGVRHLTVQVVRATYGDAYVRTDVRLATQRAMTRAFATKSDGDGDGTVASRAFDLGAPANAPDTLYGDPIPGRVKLLQLEVRCVVNRRYATTQLFSVKERCGQWLFAASDDGGVGDGGDADAGRVPPQHVYSRMNRDTRIDVEPVAIDGDIARLTPRGSLASPKTNEVAVHDASWELLPPISTSSLTLIAAAAAAAAKTRRPPTLHIVYHICTLGDWEAIVAAQLERVLVSGLYAACTALFVSVVGEHALDWQPPVEMRAKTRVVHRATDPTRYERSAIDILQSEPRDDPRECWLYLHTKGVSLAASAVNANVRLWRECLEYYAIEQYAACVAILASGRYDTCGAMWHDSGVIEGFGPHYPGNIWWATGAHLVRLRAMHMSATYLAPEMWIGYARPRAWSVHTQPPNFDLYRMSYRRSLYEGKFDLPQGVFATLASSSSLSSSPPSLSSSSPALSSPFSMSSPLPSPLPRKEASVLLQTDPLVRSVPTGVAPTDVAPPPPPEFGFP
jgi:hypothetical protein